MQYLSRREVGLVSVAIALIAVMYIVRSVGSPSIEAMRVSVDLVSWVLKYWFVSIVPFALVGALSLTRPARCSLLRTAVWTVCLGCLMTAALLLFRFRTRVATTWNEPFGVLIFGESYSGWTAVSFLWTSCVLGFAFSWWLRLVTNATGHSSPPSEPAAPAAPSTEV